MSEEYEVTIRKKDSSAEGAVGCLILIILFPIIGPCLFGGDKNKNEAPVPVVQTTSPAPVVQTTSPAPVVQTASPAPVVQTFSPAPYSGGQVQQPPVRRPVRLRCRACKGQGKIYVWPTCPACLGHCKIVDYARTEQNNRRRNNRSFNRNNHNQRVYYKNCPSCGGRGKLKQINNCHECVGRGSIVR